MSPVCAHVFVGVGVCLVSNGLAMLNIQIFLKCVTEKYDLYCIFLRHYIDPFLPLNSLYNIFS